MGILLFSFKTKTFLMKTMELFNNPNKRPRLDLSNHHDGNFGNDELWGAEDITAEEFDMLEVQATQKFGDASTNFKQPYTIGNGSESTSFLKEDEMKQKQYELEGKIKILSDSIQKMSKELQDEKLNRNKMVGQKVQEFHEKETVLRKEIQKLESVLQFKEQEMKTVYDKVKMLEIQVKDRKEKSEILVKEKKKTPENEKKKSPESSKNQVTNDFLQSFKLESESPLQASNAQEGIKKSFRRYKLLVDTPRGKTQGCDLVSSILCNRLVIPPTQNPFFSLLTSNSNTDALGRNNTQLSAVSIARLNLDKQAEELLDYFDSTLKNYLSQLKGIINKSMTSNTSPLSLRRKEFTQDRSIVISCLKDLAFFLSSDQFASLMNKWESSRIDVDQNAMVVDENEGLSTQSAQHSYDITKINEKMHSLLQSLVCLSNSNTYPNGYVKTEEIEWSLTSLVSWSTTSPENLMQFVSEIPFSAFTKTFHSVECLNMVLKLLTNVCEFKGIISVITHQNNACILCSVASLMLQKISTSPLEFLNIMLGVEDFLTVLFTIYSFNELRLESSPCSALILQGTITSLWKFYEVRKESNPKFVVILRKGFTLLHFLSRYFPNFKAKRAASEDHYISLMCGMLTLSKENSTFKDIYDLINDLWDFQDDTSEFDLDEPSEDSLQNTDLSSQNSN